MTMSLGTRLRTTLFGESHGEVVGALLEGVPAGLIIDEKQMKKDLERRRPGRRGLSSRTESDVVEIVSGVFDGKATGWPILLLCRNNDANSSDYTFLPDHPRPGHADLGETVRSGGAADLRGGGVHSGRLTLGLVAAGGIARGIADLAKFSVMAHCASVGDEDASPLSELLDGEGKLEDSERNENETAEAAASRLNCYDTDAAERFEGIIVAARRDKDSIGSTVEALVHGVQLGLGEPWFDGIEPALARGLMAIPGARAVEFGRGVISSSMRGGEHNDAWQASHDGRSGQAELEVGADGALGGMATGAAIRIIVHFKPPSSIAAQQNTLHLPSGEQRHLEVKGRHDPVLAPRAAPVVEAVTRLVMADLWLRRRHTVDEV
jgi:chorismate synthase